jgi:hypothetical protein
MGGVTTLCQQSVIVGKHFLYPPGPAKPTENLGWWQYSIRNSQFISSYERSNNGLL